MNIEQLEQTIKDAQETIKTALIEVEQMKNKDSDPRYVPKIGDTYYSVSALGGVCEDEWTNHSVDDEFLANGNVFRTREEAEKHALRLKVFNLSWAYSLAMGEIPDGRVISIIGGGLVETFTENDYGIAEFGKGGATKAIKLIGEDLIKEAWNDG